MKAKLSKCQGKVGRRRDGRTDVKKPVSGWDGYSLGHES